MYWSDEAPGLSYGAYVSGRGSWKSVVFPGACQGYHEVPLCDNKALNDARHTEPRSIETTFAVPWKLEAASVATAVTFTPLCESGCPKRLILVHLTRVAAVYTCPGRWSGRQTSFVTGTVSMTRARTVIYKRQAFVMPHMYEMWIPMML